MAFGPGTRLGVYEILALIGSGGMGEVYRAKDTKLHRDVAIKVLATEVAADADRLARFEREAQVLASLNHPNIAHIHGVEDSTGAPALVMELVEGPTLADRIASGPIPLHEALAIAKQIAEALEAAHEQGIIHRDLKPANIKVRPDGTVKVLDFGLAKAFAPTVGVGGTATTSPTLSIHATQAGIILGTAAYMPPEQAAGKPVDRRADIWAFGVVLWEILVGRRLFDGETVTHTLADVLGAPIDFNRLPKSTPRPIRELLRRSLDRNVSTRLRDIGEARIALGRALTVDAAADADATAAFGTAAWRHRGALAAALISGTLLAAGLWFVSRSPNPPVRVSRFAITPGGEEAISISGAGRDVVLTSDGSRIVYVGAHGTALFVRTIDQIEPTLLLHGAPRDPFVSPDGQWIGFFDGGFTLKKAPINGGPAVVIARLNSYERGGTWLEDDTIVFATQNSAVGLQRVSAGGGTPTVLTRPDRTRGEAGHAWPERLPGGRAVLYTVTATAGGLEAASIAAVDVSSGRSVILVRGGTHGQYVSSGHLIFGAAGALRAVGFDPARLMLTGQPVVVLPQVGITSFGAIEAAVSADGTLTYVPGTTGNGAERTLVWVDRQGRETAIAAPPHAYYFPRVSSDGAQIVVNAVVDQNADLWLWDISRATLTRVTTDPANEAYPLFMPDGRHLVFASNRTGAFNLFAQATDGSGDVQRLTESPNPQFPSAVSPDGSYVLFSETGPTTGDDVMELRLDGTHQISPLIQTSFDERNGTVSPDGRWLAYEANDTGVFEIYVRPFPDVGAARWQVSTTGGYQALWAPDGKQLFYYARDGALMRVDVGSGSSWKVGTPVRQVDANYVTSTAGNSARNYDISPDGERFLMLKVPDGQRAGSAASLVLVQHFDQELRRIGAK